MSNPTIGVTAVTNDLSKGDTARYLQAFRAAARENATTDGPKKTFLDVLCELAAEA